MLKVYLNGPDMLFNRSTVADRVPAVTESDRQTAYESSFVVPVEHE